MTRLLKSTVLALCVAACGGGVDTVTETCERLDECNVLGTSINDCTEELDVALAQATPSDRSDWERLMNNCLEFEGCSTFLSCAGLSDGGGSGSGPGGNTGDGGTPGDDGDPGQPAPGP